MPRRSDSKTRMIAAARRLFGERGYVGTAFSDVLAESAAPRGSVYFHFPGGKEELGIEVALMHLADTVSRINRSALRVGTAAAMIEEFVNHSRDRLAASGYREGCAVAPIVIEMTPASQQLTDVTRRGFQDVVSTFAARLAEKGVPAAEATDLATATVAGVEGALIVARSLRDDSPFETVRALLVERANRVSNSTDATAR
jgi:TetR/AcrR family transcriptional repressor of lmrAB and yxaGH operons